MNLCRLPFTVEIFGVYVYKGTIWLPFYVIEENTLQVYGEKNAAKIFIYKKYWIIPNFWINVIRSAGRIGRLGFYFAGDKYYL